MKRVAKKKAVKKRVTKRVVIPSTKVPAWSESAYWSFIRSGLRSKWMRYPIKYEAMNRARRKAVAPAGKLKWEFQCAMCGQWHPQKNVSVDHIIPCGSLRCYADLALFVERLFCSIEGVQVLCSTCHTTKTNTDRGKKDE